MRKDFSRSTLVRLLGDWAPVPAPDSREDFAQRLSQWVGVADAVTLHTAHQPARAAPARRPVAAAAIARDLNARLLRVRAGLIEAITATPATPAPNPRDRHAPPPVATADEEAPASFAPHRQRYLAAQRQMALRVEALRGQVRQAIAQASPALAQLAAFDAVLEQMLGAREQGLMATVPAVLERRFEALRATASTNDDAATWRQPGGWLHRFDHDLQATLLAELEQRLQPVTGLIEALDDPQLETQG